MMSSVHRVKDPAANVDSTEHILHQPVDFLSKCSILSICKHSVSSSSGSVSVGLSQHSQSLWALSDFLSGPTLRTRSIRKESDNFCQKTKILNKNYC